MGPLPNDRFMAGLMGVIRSLCFLAVISGVITQLPIYKAIYKGPVTPLITELFSLESISPCLLASTHLCQGLNSHYFHIIGDGHQPNSRGLYTHYKDSYTHLIRCEMFFQDLGLAILRESDLFGMVKHP